MFTAAIVAVCLAALLIPPRLPFGLEFSSGTSLTVQFDEPVDLEDVRARLAEIDHGDASVQALTDTSFFIRTEFVEEDLLTRLADAFGPLTPSAASSGPPTWRRRCSSWTPSRRTTCSKRSATSPPKARASSPPAPTASSWPPPAWMRSA